MPTARAWRYVLALPPLALVAGAALLLNLPPLLVAFFAAKGLADARNVVALWRIIAGVPALLAWTAVVAVLAPSWLLALYAATTLLGMAAFYRAGKVAVSVYNLGRGRALRSELLAVKRSIDEALLHEG